MLQTYDEVKKQRKTWHRRFGEESPSDRLADELKEVVMLHAKSLDRDMTSGYTKKCRFDYAKKWKGCWVAYPWPSGNRTKEKNAHDDDGMEYNCHINQRVDEIWVPKLRDALEKRKNK